MSPSFEPLEELKKDCWDARNIPGLRYTPHTSNYYVHFTGVPERFRPLVKEYAAVKVAGGRTTATLRLCTRCLADFFVFFTQRHPQASTLHTLNAQDMDAFVLALRAQANARQLKDVPQHILHRMSYVADLLCYLERIQSPLRPSEPTSRIIWSHHYPKQDYRKLPRHIQYIPASVLQQLDTHLHHLQPVYIPVVILLRASGWRISDVLFLKWDTCLKQEREHSWLVGDIQKTRVLGHRIPITKEIAAVIRAQIAWVRQHYTETENPKHWLFPASKRKQHLNTSRFKNHDPLCVVGVYDALNHLVAKYQIQDE